MADSLYVMSPVEVAWGYVFGHEGSIPPPRDPSASARTALERVIRDALQRPPCGVAFSGGRDSSAVLAIAMHVARREGLPHPIPITRVFPDAPDAEETEWQTMVLRHLGATDWQRIELHDEIDLLGPLAQETILEHGVLWPPTLHAYVPVQEVVRGGTLLDGEGGDELLDCRFHRVGPLTAIVRHPRPFRRHRIRRAAGALAPSVVRAGRARQRAAATNRTWLRSQAFEALVDAYVEDQRREPLRFGASVRRMTTLRQQRAFERNREALARARDVRMVSPLQEPDVVHAWAREAGFFGPLDRTTALRALVPDLLPDAIISRTSKATFGDAFEGRHTREFVERWTGEGVDTDLVDPDELARVWRSGAPMALTAALLQSAWRHRHAPSEIPAQGHEA